MSEIVHYVISLIQEWYTLLIPWFVQGDDEVGLVRRLGKYHRDSVAGLNWKIPIIEEHESTSGALESVSLSEQTLTTADGETVTVRGALSYRVTDARKYLLDCGDAEGVLNDIVCCVIGEVVPELVADDVLMGDVRDALLEPMGERAEKWGVEFIDLSLTERTKTRTFRLLQG